MPNFLITIAPYILMLIVIFIGVRNVMSILIEVRKQDLERQNDEGHY